MLRQWAQVPSVPVGILVRKNGQSTLGRAPVRCLASKGKKNANGDESKPDKCCIALELLCMVVSNTVQRHMMRFHTITITCCTLCRSVF